MNPPSSDSSPGDALSQARKSRLGRWSLILGILAVCLLGIYIFAPGYSSKFRMLANAESYGKFSALFLLPGLLSVILANIARFKVRRDGTTPSEWDAAGFGLRLGFLALVPGLLMAIAVPSFHRARMRAKASTVLSSNLRCVDGAKDQYALENSKEKDVKPQWADLTPYLKAGSKLAMDGGNDEMGNPILIGSVGERLRVNPKTKEMLEEAADDQFWGPFS